MNLSYRPAGAIDPKAHSQPGLFRGRNQPGVYSSVRPDAAFSMKAATSKGAASIETCAAFGAPATSPAWKNKPAWFVIASKDRTISPELEATEAARMNATTMTVRTGHLAMLAEPDRIADFIRRAVEKVGAK